MVLSIRVMACSNKFSWICLVRVPSVKLVVTVIVWISFNYGWMPWITTPVGSPVRNFLWHISSRTNSLSIESMLQRGQTPRESLRCWSWFVLKAEVVAYPGWTTTTGLECKTRLGLSMEGNRPSHSCPSMGRWSSKFPWVPFPSIRISLMDPSGCYWSWCLPVLQLCSWARLPTTFWLGWEIGIVASAWAKKEKGGSCER